MDFNYFPFMSVQYVGYTNLALENMMVSDGDSMVLW